MKNRPAYAIASVDHALQLATILQTPGRQPRRTRLHGASPGDAPRRLRNADLDQVWPAQALRALHGLNIAAHQARDQQLPVIPPEIADPLLGSWRHALLVGLTEHRRASGRRQTKTRNLLERLRDRDEQVLLFARDLTVPFTNNQAERDVRPTKNPTQDQRLSPLAGHRDSLAPHPWLHLYRRQARRERPRSAPRRHHRQPLDTTRDLLT